MKKTITTTALVCLWTFNGVLAALASEVAHTPAMKTLVFLAWPWACFLLIVPAVMLDSRFRSFYRFLQVSCVSQIIGIIAALLYLVRQ